jgi:hypothetical protein
MAYATQVQPVEFATAAGASTETVSDSTVLRSKHAQASKAMALATFAMAAGSGLQALLYLRAFGVNAQTDGFFAAFALYAVFGIFSQSIRVTSAPLLVGKRPAIMLRQFALALGLIAVPVVLVTGPLAGVLAHLLAPSGGTASRHVMEEALPILGAAMVLQLWAAGGATLLAVDDRFGAIASAYGAGALAGVIGYVALESATGERVLGFSMLTMAIVTFAMMVGPVRAAWRHQSAGRSASSRGSLQPRALLRCVGSLLGRTGIYLAFNGLYLVTLAFAGRYHTGDATVVSYAYLFSSYLVAGTGFALGMARVADMARSASVGSDVLGTVPQGFRYTMLVSAPALAGLIACGAPLIGAVLPKSLSPHDVVLLQRFALLMVPWMVGAQLVNLLLPVAFAEGRSRGVNMLAPVLVVAQVVFTAVGAALFGLYGAVGAMCLATLGFVAVMLAASRKSRPDRDLRPLLIKLGSDTLRFGLLAVVSFGVGYLVSQQAPEGVARPVIAGFIGVGGYVAGLLVLAREQVAKLLNRSGPSTAVAETAVSRATVAEDNVADDTVANDPVAGAAAGEIVESPAMSVSSDDAAPTSSVGTGRRRRRWISSGWFAVILLVAFGAVSMARQWNGTILWETDGLFYQAKVLEIRGESQQEALKQTFQGPLAAWSRQIAATQGGQAGRLQNQPSWSQYSAKFYNRRLALPYAAAALYPLLGDRSLQFLSLLGYVLLGPLMYALLRQRFRHRTSLLVALAVMLIPPVRDWAVFPMTDSWGLTLEVAAILAAVLALKRGPRWLVPWMLTVFLLSITRDTAFIPVVAAGVLMLMTRTRMSALLTATGFLASLPAPLLYPTDERQQLAYVFGNHTIPKDTSWSYVISHYLPNLGTMFHRDLQYAGAHPVTIAIFVIGIVALFAWAPRRETWFILVKGLALGYLLLLAIGPSYSVFRYELVLVPLVAAGLALCLDRAFAYAERWRTSRSRSATTAMAGATLAVANAPSLAAGRGGTSPDTPPAAGS